MKQKKKKKKKGVFWRLRKYYRWFRSYHLKVRMVEREIGDEIHPC